MKQFTVSGMSCVVCVRTVEQAVLAVEGVMDCRVNLLTRSMEVEGAAENEAILRAVEAAGYTATLADGRPESCEERKSPLRGRLVVSILLLVVLMGLSMGPMIGLPLPECISSRSLLSGGIQCVLASVILWIHRGYFVRGLQSARHLSPNMDTLVALGSGIAFVSSCVSLFLAVSFHRSAPWYFDSAAMIVTLVSVGKALEERSKEETTNAIRSLLQLRPETAVVIREGKEQRVPISLVRVGDRFVLRPGEVIPVDGVIEEGEGAVNESILTGESIPVDKKAGDWVSGATVNESGFLVCRADRVGEDTTLAQIVRLVRDAAAQKAPIGRFADRICSVFVPAVLAIALLTGVIWMAVGAGPGFALERAVAVLVISCPCALGLATPVAIMVAGGKGAKAGILFKHASAMEQMGRIRTVVLDKTGTLTKGEPEVREILPATGIDADELLRLAYSLERKSEHPLANAVVRYTGQRQQRVDDACDFIALGGRGVCATVNGQRAYGGKWEYVASVCSVEETIKRQVEVLEREGRTALYFATADTFMGAVTVSDSIKDDGASAVAQLKELGLDVVLLSGDSQSTAEAVGRQAGISQVIGGVLPQEKEETVRRLQEKGRVAMVGDGINDAPALARADLGIAVGTGTDVAVDAADVVIMGSRLSAIPAAVRLGRATLRVICQNLFWAFFYNAVGIPLAAGVFHSWLGWELPPMFGAAAMSLSSFCVVSNALRINAIPIFPKNIIKKEQKTMKKTMKIEGMMCPHCEGRVKKTLEALDGVSSAEVSHEKGWAVLELNENVEDALLRSAVEAQGYTVTCVE